MEKGAQRVLELESELANARTTLADLQQELEDGRKQLAKLREDLLKDKEPLAEVEAETETVGVAELHAQLTAARAARDALANAAADERRGVADLVMLGVPGLQNRLEKCVSDHTQALVDARWAQASIMAESMRKMTAALGQAHAAAAQEPSAFNPNSRGRSRRRQGELRDIRQARRQLAAAS